jgi:hypothetical protein
MLIPPDEHEKWIKHHLKRRKGERLRRLKVGYQGPVEMLLKCVVYPVIPSFQHLHPEYEVSNIGHAPIYLDLAFICGVVRIDFELDGFGAHCRDMDRYQFMKERRRDLNLVADGWIVLRFAYDDVVANPEQLQTLVRRTFEREMVSIQLAPLERETVRFARAQPGLTFKPRELQVHLWLKRDATNRLIKRLVESKILLATGTGTVRVKKYQLNLAHKLFRQLPYEK